MRFSWVLAGFFTALAVVVFTVEDSQNRTLRAQVTATQSLCGDGIIQVAGDDGISGTSDDEACDDANVINGDGCNQDCKAEQVCPPSEDRFHCQGEFHTLERERCSADCLCSSPHVLSCFDACANDVENWINPLNGESIHFGLDGNPDACRSWCVLQMCPFGGKEEPTQPIVNKEVGNCCSFLGLDAIFYDPLDGQTELGEQIGGKFEPFCGYNAFHPVTNDDAPDGFIRYETAQKLDEQKGAICMTVAPKYNSKEAIERNPEYFFSEQSGFNELLVSTVHRAHRNTDLLLYSRRQEGVQNPIFKNWQFNACTNASTDWYTLAATWNAPRQQLYLGSNRLVSHPTPAGIGSVDSSMYIGSLLGNANFANFAIRDFYVCGSATSTEEIPVVERTVFCGNGRREGNEECDDGNTLPGDGCAPDCRIEQVASLTYCGDGKVDAGEQCDDGDVNGSEQSSCRNNCTILQCGDGIVDHSEECDDGNSDNNDECTQSCELTKPAAPQGSILDIDFPTTVQGQSQEMVEQLVTATLKPISLSEEYIPLRPVPVETGPAAVTIMAAGAAFGFGWMRRKRKK